MLETKIIYSLKVVAQLVAMGYQPVASMPNPKKPDFLCWIFEVTPEFQRALDKIFGGEHYGF